MEVIVKTFQYCYIIVHIHAPLFIFKFQHHRHMRHVATKEHQCREIVNIVKTFKDLCDNFCDFFYVVDGLTILFSFICQLKNHHTYI